MLRHVKDAVFLINTAQRLRRLQVFVMIFPLPSTSTAPMSQCPSDLASYLPNWKISTSRLSTSSHGDHIAASRLFVWDVSSYILLPFIPPHVYLFGTECPQSLSICMNQNFNSALNSLGSVSTTTLDAAQYFRHQPSAFQPRPLALVSKSPQLEVTDSNLVFGYFPSWRRCGS